MISRFRVATHISSSKHASCQHVSKRSRPISLGAPHLYKVCRAFCYMSCPYATCHVILSCISWLIFTLVSRQYSCSRSESRLCLSGSLFDLDHSCCVVTQLHDRAASLFQNSNLLYIYVPKYNIVKFYVVTLMIHWRVENLILTSSPYFRYGHVPYVILSYSISALYLYP